MLGFERITFDPKIMAGQACIRVWASSGFINFKLNCQRKKFGRNYRRLSLFGTRRYSPVVNVCCLVKQRSSIYQIAGESLMKFLADMGISPRTVNWLKSNGYDAVHLADEG